MDFILNVFNGDEFVLSLCGSNMYYDNVIWWELSNLIKKFRGLRVTKKQLIDYVKRESFYFCICGLDYEEIKDNPNIDFVHQRIDNKKLMIEEFENVSDEFDVLLIKKDNNYYVQYEDDSKYLLQRVYCNQDLIDKKVLSFSEFLILSDFIDECLEINDYDYILNDNLFLRLNCI